MRLTGIFLRVRRLHLERHERAGGGRHRARVDARDQGTGRWGASVRPGERDGVRDGHGGRIGYDRGGRENDRGTLRSRVLGQGGARASTRDGGGPRGLGRARGVVCTHGRRAGYVR